MFEDPELFMIRFEGNEEERSGHERQRAESRRRYVEAISMALVEMGLSPVEAPSLADEVFDRLFMVRSPDDDGAPGDPCSCSCHPRVPDLDLHDYGFGCPCQESPEERQRRWEECQAESDAFWDSAEGQALVAQNQAQEDRLLVWLASNPHVSVRSYGGTVPEQWWGSVDGHTFFFRERHDDWRIELDLRPSGHFYKAWTGGDLGDDASYQTKEWEEGDVIARGTIDDDGYGSEPVERIQFIVRMIRDHLRRRSCALHPSGLHDLEARLGLSVNWCPACGTRLAG